METERPYLRKAEESLAGAEAELAGGRFNNAANRAYYACFQAAVQALADAGVRPLRGQEWSHAAVPAEFVGLLINRRKLYPGDLRDVLPHTWATREIADYRAQDVSSIRAERAVGRAARMVGAVRARGGPR